MIPDGFFLRNIELTNHKYLPLNKPFFEPDFESERIITKDSSEYVRSFFSSKMREIEEVREDDLITYIKNHYYKQINLELDKQLKENLDEENLTALKEKYKEDVTEASFFWDQAIEFYKGTINMDIHVKPLSIYYFMLNAAKALLVFNGVLYKDRNNKNVYHGVTGLDFKKINTSKFLVNTTEHRVKYFNDNSDFGSIDSQQHDYNFTKLKGLYILSKDGVFTNLGNFFGNKIKSMEIFSLDNLISNLVFVHRAYSVCNDINIDNQLFIPLESQCFGIYPKKGNKFVYYFKIDAKYKLNSEENITDLNTYVNEKGNHYMIKSDQSYSENINDIKNFIFDIRLKHQYIAGVKPRWYLMKESDCGNINLKLNPLVILLGIFHRLSEFSRYNPLKLKNLLDSKKNDTAWLLRELIENAAYQFMDLISSEITHKEFHLPRTY